MVINIEGGHVKFTLNLDSKVSIIQGLSAKHKTWMVNAAEAGEPAYKVQISDSEFQLRVLRKGSWSDVLFANEFSKSKRIYLVDDQDFVESLEFAQAVSKDSTCYYLIINRVSGLLSYDVRSVYRLVAEGIEHFLQPLYNISCVDKIFGKTKFYTEDSTSGLRWFRELIPEAETTYGAPGIKGIVAAWKNASLCIAADLFGLGYYIEDIMREAVKHNNTVTFLRDYGSFEYLLLRSNLFKYELSENEILSGMSKEIVCEDIISRLTKSKYYKYEKSYNLNFCYYKDCCARSRKEKCDRGLSGDKIEAMLKGTEFEYLLSFRSSPKKGVSMLEGLKDIKI